MSAPFQLVLGAQGTVSEHATLAEAVRAWGRVLETQPLADLMIVRQGEILADVDKHDTCTVHEIAFSKEINCPSCDDEEDDPYLADRASRRRSLDAVVALLARDEQDKVLTAQERVALHSALYWLED